MIAKALNVNTCVPKVWIFIKILKISIFFIFFYVPIINERVYAVIKILLILKLYHIYYFYLIY